MDQFKTLYYDYCKTYHIEPNESVLGEIEKISKNDNQKKTFNLSSLTIPDGQYIVLGKLFSKDFLCTNINLNDCNLSSEALQSFLHGLVKNTTCRTLELKGNSIHGAGTEALAQVLRRNQTLQTLRLEWNQIGSMDTPAFTSFCDALANNKSLIELDLRNNDISHVGGTELAAALKRNVTLRILDLRWNKIGLVGSRALLATCQSNSTLNELLLVGNDVPDDILQNINNALAKNTEKRQVHFGHSQNMAVLARQLQNVHTEKDRQISSVITRASIQEQAMIKANKSLSEKIKKLQEGLNDRQLAFNALSAKNALLEADITVVTQQYNDAINQTKKLQIEKQQLLIQLRKEHQQEKDELFHVQEKFQFDLNQNLEIQRRLNEKVHDLERKNDLLQATIYELRENILINDRDHHSKLSAIDTENQQLKSKHKEDIKTLELTYTREIHRLKESHFTVEQGLKNQVNKLDNIRITLEQEIDNLKAVRSTQKLNYEEILQQEKLRIKTDYDRKQFELEDRLRSLITSKEELESTCNQQSRINQELQHKLHYQSVEIETLKRQVDTLQTANLSKDTELLEIRERSRTEYERKIHLIQKDIELNDSLKDHIRKIETELKDQRFNDQNLVRELDTMVIDLQTKLKQREQELIQLKQNEEKRLHFLRTAMLEYINRGTKIN